MSKTEELLNVRAKAHGYEDFRDAVVRRLDPLETQSIAEEAMNAYADQRVSEALNSQWVSVKTDPPKALRWVMVWVESRSMAFMVCYRAYPDDKGFMWDGYHVFGIDPNEFELWQPLPSPPLNH